MTSATPRALLGHVPRVRGIVVHGAARGRELGFPTANLSPESEGLIPADGVYAGWLTDDGVRYPAAISVGNNPTFEGVPQKQVEAYVLDEDLDLYDHRVEIAFVERIRGMVAFSGIDPLIAQIAADVERARAHPRLIRPESRSRGRLRCADRIDGARPPQRPLWHGRTLALLGILLVAANLRTAVAALSPIFAEIRVDFAISSIAVGVLGMLPPVCFAVFGIVAPAFTRRASLETRHGHRARGDPRSATWCARSSGSFVVLAIGSAITFAGMGVGNVLLPPLVKRYFPDRIGLVTSLYATVISISTLLPPLIAVPVADGRAGACRSGCGAR